MHAFAPSVPSDVRAILDALGIAARGASEPGSMAHTPERVFGDALSLSETVRLSGDVGPTRRAAALENARDDDAAGRREAVATVLGDDRVDDAVEHAEQAAGAALHAELTAQIGERVRALRRRADAAYAGAFTGQNGLPDAARTLALLRELGALPGDARMRVQASRSIAGGYAQLFSAVLATAQRDVERLKQEVGSQLRDRRPAAARLLRLDSVVDGLITRQLGLRQQALGRALEQGCARRFELAIEQLAPECGPGGLEGWFGQRGVTTELLALSLRLVHALLDLELFALHGLVDAACSESKGELDEELDEEVGER